MLLVWRSKPDNYIILVFRYFVLYSDYSEYSSQILSPWLEDIVDHGLGLLVTARQATRLPGGPLQHRYAILSTMAAIVDNRQL